MKHFLFPLVVLVLVCSFLTSCPSFGGTGDELALFKPAVLAWPAVEDDFDRGLEDGVADGDLTVDGAQALELQSDELERALGEADREALRLVLWNTLEPWADRGIDTKVAAGEIGTGVAGSLREQLDNFTTVVLKLQEIR